MMDVRTTTPPLLDASGSALFATPHGAAVPFGPGAVIEAPLVPGGGARPRSSAEGDDGGGPTCHRSPEALVAESLCLRHGKNQLKKKCTCGKARKYMTQGRGYVPPSQSEATREFVEDGVAPVVAAMGTHPGDPAVQSWCCFALGNACRNAELAAIVRDRGGGAAAAAALADWGHDPRWSTLAARARRVQALLAPGAFDDVAKPLPKPKKRRKGETRMLPPTDGP